MGRKALSEIGPSPFEIESEYISAPLLLEKVYRKILEEWPHLTMQLARPIMLAMIKSDREAKDPRIRINEISRFAFGKKNWLLALGAWVGTPCFVYVLLAVPLPSGTELDQWSLIEKFHTMITGRRYQKAALLYASDDEVCVASGHSLSLELRRHFQAKQLERGIIAAAEGGMLYANPDVLRNYFSKPFLKDLHKLFSS